MSAPDPAAGPCPCGRVDLRRKTLSYAACCGRYVDDFDHTPAPDAESLMRSRYTAFVRERADYLRATWAASQRPAELSFDAGVKWLGLDVRARAQRGADQAEVEFVARSRDATGRAHRLHERSRFVREGGRWFYVDGELF